jgi:hypothetical protein
MIATTINAIIIKEKKALYTYERAFFIFSISTKNHLPWTNENFHMLASSVTYKLVAERIKIW